MTTPKITIPEEALKHAALVVWEHPKIDISTETAMEIARAACLAMLKHWPGMGPIRTDQPIGDWCDKLPAIILPLPQEASNE